MTRRLELPDSGTRGADGLAFAPSAARNTAPIGEILARELPARGTVLELAAGTGQHAVAFAARFPGLDWQPTDMDPDSLRAIAARVTAAGLPNLHPPHRLDACAPGWADAWRGRDAIVLVNLLHLIPDDAAATLLDELPRALARDGVACLYGPFRRDGALQGAGDRAFDAHLRAQDPRIGYKDIASVAAALVHAGLRAQARIEMPAGNLMLIARRAPAP